MLVNQVPRPCCNFTSLIAMFYQYSTKFVHLISEHLTHFSRSAQGRQNSSFYSGGTCFTKRNTQGFLLGSESESFPLLALFPCLPSLTSHILGQGSVNSLSARIQLISPVTREYLSMQRAGEFSHRSAFLKHGACQQILIHGSKERRLVGWSGQPVTQQGPRTAQHMVY